MIASMRYPLRSLVVGSVAIATLLVSGCGDSITAAPLDSSRARDALKTTLDAWQAGSTPDSLKSGSPSITAQDLEWLGGAKLVGYQIEGEGTAVGSNLRVPVQLSLKSKGKDAKKTVHYLVSTSPSVTVFRDFH
jgi:hypothetical protein